jgi:Flp pilus assembly protein TadG
MESALANGGFSSTAQYFVKNQLQQAGGGGSSAGSASPAEKCAAQTQQMAAAMTPFLDPRSWYDMAVPLEEIILSPDEGVHAFTQSNLTNEGSPWFRSLVGLFSSPKVRPTRATLNTASFIGFGDFVSMFQAAQRVRRSADAAAAAAAESGQVPQQQAARKKFSPKAEVMVQSAIRLVHGNGRSGTESEVTANVEALTRCLRMVDVIGPVNSTSKAEFTWFKLCEWLQVEMIQDFGAFMESQAWFRYPFMATLAVYWTTLAKEMKVVHRKYGLAKATTSAGFVTDFVPGIAMANIFTQLAAAAVPCNMAFGGAYKESDDGTSASYDPAELEKQMERLVVTFDPNSSSTVDWAHLVEYDHATVKVQELLPGLCALTVPSLKFLQTYIFAMEKLPQECGATILSISDQKEVQVRVTVAEQHQVRLIDAMSGCKVMFDFKLPTQKQEVAVSVEVQVQHLLPFIEQCGRHGFGVRQIYDFY